MDIGRTSRKRIQRVTISPFENADISQFTDSLDAAANLFEVEPEFDIGLYFTYPHSDAEVKRKQRDAILLIHSANESLSGSIAGGHHPILLVTNQDLFSGRSSFVFGLSNTSLGIAVMSTARLTRWVEDLTPSKIQERILKEAGHEIGHLIGLQHCEERFCLMRQTEGLEDLDSKIPMLCNNCRKNLPQARVS